MTTRVRSFRRSRQTSLRPYRLESPVFVGFLGRFAWTPVDKSKRVHFSHGVAAEPGETGVLCLVAGCVCLGAWRLAVGRDNVGAVCTRPLV